MSARLPAENQQSLGFSHGRERGNHRQRFLPGVIGADM
jgi:hypothetical protein